MSKIIVFSKLNSFLSGFEKFASNREDLKALDDDGEKILFFNEKISLFIIASDFSNDGLYLVFDKIKLKDFNHLMNGYDRSEFYILKHTMPSFVIEGVAKNLTGRHESSQSGGLYYPTLVDILSDSQPNKVQRFFEATFRSEEHNANRLDIYFDNLYKAELGEDYWLGYLPRPSDKLLFWDSDENFTLEMCNQSEIAQEDSLTSLQQFRNYDFRIRKNVVILLLESNLEDKNRSDFYGLELVVLLRKELRFKGLIIVYSSLSEDEIRQQVPNSGILFTSGVRIFPIGFQNRPLHGAEINLLSASIELTEDLLDDIDYNVLDHKGKVHELLHNLKNELGSLKALGFADLAKAIKDTLNSYEFLFKKEIDRINILEFDQVYLKLRTELLEDLESKLQNENTDNYNNGWHVVNKYASYIASISHSNGYNDAIPIRKDEVWQVLYLEDTEGIRDKVKAYFEKRNVVCHVARNENEVFNCLKEHQDKISVFITDIRLLDEKGHWCDKQGYDVIDAVIQRSNYPLVYAVLTSKKGTISKMVQKKHVAQPLWFSKDDVLDNEHSFNIFFDVIKSYAVAFADHNMFQPENGPWENSNSGQCNVPMKLYYKAHKESPDYLDVEERLNKEALDFILDEVDDGDKKKGEGWMCKLDDDEINEKGLSKFRDFRLLGRRIVLAYIAQGYHDDAVSIHNKLRKKKIAVKDSDTKQFFSKLALPTNFQKYKNLKNFDASKGKNAGILYEEYEFLKREFFENRKSGEARLGEEWVLFKKFLINIKSFFAAQMLEVNVPVFDKMNFEVRKGNNPNIRMIEDMFVELSAIDNQLHNRLAWETLKGLKFRTPIIKKLLEKYQWQ